MAFIDSCSSPELAAITDERHPNSYGRVFAVSTASSSLGFIFGPIIGKFLTRILLTKWRNCTFEAFEFSIHLDG